MVPEAQNPVAQTFQILRPVTILLFTMLTAIGFDNQLFLDADEVGDIGTKLQLPPEFTSAKLPRPQVVPKQCFDLGRTAT
jgi:hypothetical protein